MNCIPAIKFCVIAEIIKVTPSFRLTNAFRLEFYKGHENFGLTH